jgi:hypothetical protein
MTGTVGVGESEADDKTAKLKIEAKKFERVLKVRLPNIL